MDPKWSNEEVQAGWGAWRANVDPGDARAILDDAMRRVMTRAVELFAARGPGMTLAKLGEDLGAVRFGADGWSEAAEKIEADYVGLLAKVVELEAQLTTHGSYRKDDAARGGPLSETEVAEELERITSLGVGDRALARYRISVHLAAQGAMLEAQGTDLTASRGTQRVLMEERDAALARVAELGAAAHADLRRHEEELEALRRTSRDEFACAALQGLTANQSRSATIEGDAKRAYDYADAMLAERKRGAP